MTARPVDKFLPLLEQVRERGKFQWTGRCPAHEDKSPSLSVRETEDGRVLLHCFAGCSINEIVSAIGKELRDLFPDNPNRDPEQRSWRPRLDGWTAVSILEHRLGMILIVAGDICAGKKVPEADLKDLCEACADVKAILEEAREIR